MTVSHMIMRPKCAPPPSSKDLHLLSLALATGMQSVGLSLTMLLSSGECVMSLKQKVIQFSSVTLYSSHKGQFHQMGS